MKNIGRRLLLGLRSARGRGVLIFWFVWTVSFLFSTAAYAQGQGVVDGRLVNRTNPSIVPAKVDLDVIGFGGGMSVLTSATTDADGKFHIGGLPTNSPLMIRANYKMVNYNAQFTIDPSGKGHVEVEVFEPTTSMAGIRLSSLRMACQLSGDRVQEIEEYSFNNQTAPPKSLMNPEGNFRFSKAQGILEPPRMNVAGPGAPMPLNQSPLESPDGQSYYSLFPLRPGITTFQLQQLLPYTDHTYTYRKKFYQDVDSFQLGVIPQDMAVSGGGLTNVQTDSQRNFAVYEGGPIKAGTEVVWTFSGGTPPPVPATTENPGESTVKPKPTSVGRNALIVGPLLLMGLIAVLWYAFNRSEISAPKKQNPRSKELLDRREQLLNYLADLDNKFENQALDRREYLRHREQGKRQLRRIALLLKK